jgi:hypothetical protein
MFNPVLSLLLIVFVCAPWPEAPRTNAEQRSLLSRLEGNWAGTGTFQGQPAAQRMRWEPVLEGKFVRLTLRVETKPATGQPIIFAGNAYYPAHGAAASRARWFDSAGNDYAIQYSMQAQQTAELLTALWGEPGRVEGQSTYRLSAAGQQLEVVDAVRAQDGTWKEFGRFVLRRTAQPDERVR